MLFFVQTLGFLAITFSGFFIYKLFYINIGGSEILYKEADIITFGEIARYSKRWIPFFRKTHIVVKIGREMVQVPVDNRQIKFIEKEHPVGSIVELEFDSDWRIRSRMAPIDYDITGVAQELY